MIAMKMAHIARHFVDVRRRRKSLTRCRASERAKAVLALQALMSAPLLQQRQGPSDRVLRAKQRELFQREYLLRVSSNVCSLYFFYTQTRQPSQPRLTSRTLAHTHARLQRSMRDNKKRIHNQTHHHNHPPINRQRQTQFPQKLPAPLPPSRLPTPSVPPRRRCSLANGR